MNIIREHTVDVWAVMSHSVLVNNNVLKLCSPE